MTSPTPKLLPVSTGPRLIVYHQTYHDSNGNYHSLLPLLTNNTGITHVIIAAIHLNDGPGNITLNDHGPDDKRYDQLWGEVNWLQGSGVKVLGMLGGAAKGSFEKLSGDEENVRHNTCEPMSCYSTWMLTKVSVRSILLAPPRPDTPLLPLRPRPRRRRRNHLIYHHAPYIPPAHRLRSRVRHNSSSRGHGPYSRPQHPRAPAPSPPHAGIGTEPQSSTPHFTAPQRVQLSRAGVQCFR